MRRVIIESPFAGDRKQNHEYLLKALKDSLSRGEAPFASHAIYPLVLDDLKQDERALGIEAGYAWLQQANMVAFYIDLGWSPGMHAAMSEVRRLSMTYVLRKI